MVCTGKETENMFMMPIDTGNKAIKTENFEFNSGITMLADVPGENEEALMYQGRYYRLSHERNVYLPDKTMDDRYYLLTLFAIAKELEEMSHSKSFIPGELISMDLVVGLPPLYYRGQYKKFREYFYRDGKIVHFVYMGKSYRVTFSNVFVHMQTYAAYMGWLLELLVEGIREMLSQFVIDMMTLVTDMFTELLSCDLSLFEELFSVVGDLYKNVVLPMGIALLLLICVWQLFKSMFGKAGVASEDPIELVCRTGISLFFIVAAKPLVDYILAVAGTPYQWITGTDVEVSSFSEYVSVLEGLTGGLGIDSLNIAILMLIMQFVVAWNYFKMLFVIAERYVLLGVFSYTAPLAFGTGGSKATNNILASWAKMFGGQIILILLNSWCLKMFLSGYGNLNASAYGFTKFFVATLCLVGFCKVTFKLDSYLSSLGVNLGRPTTGIGALGLMMAAGRVLSHVGRGSGESSGSSSPTGTESQTAATDGAGMTDAPPGPIPMGFPGDSDAMRMDGENEFSGATTDETADMELANGDFDTMDDEQGSVLEEMGMMPQDSFAETEDGMMDMSGMQDDTDFDSGTTSQNDADAFVDGMDNSDINGAFTGEGSAVNDLGDYPVEEEEAGMEESSEPDMELEGNAIGSAGGDDIGIGSGMDTSGGETALSGGNPSSGEQASVQSGGIISEISGSAGMKLSDSSETSGGVYASNEGESSYTVGGQGYTSEGRSPHTDFSSARENGKYESEGYHDFDGPMYQNTSTNMESNQGIHAEELKKREQGIGSESGEIREVPKTREEFRKKNQRNHSHSEDHFLT